MNARRVALYARVSTKNNGQNPETQLIGLREYSARRGFHIFDEYIDVGISGAKDRRPQLDRLMTDARRREFDVVLVARFDRFARSVKHLSNALEEFNAIGIDFISLNESVDTSTPMGKMVFTILAAVGELERNIIRERVVMGMERAKRQGKHIGRRRLVVRTLEVVRLKEEGLSLRQIAAEVGISHTKVAQVLRAEGM